MIPNLMAPSSALYLTPELESLGGSHMSRRASFDTPWDWPRVAVTWATQSELTAMERWRLHSVS